MVAFQAKNIVQAFMQPTVAMAIRDLGEGGVLVALSVAIKEAMEEYFSVEQQLPEHLHSSLAEAIMEKYRHESLGDVPVFLKHASWGRYGQVTEDGRVVDKGQTYGRLTVTRLMGWFEQYLADKADALAEARERGNKELNGTRLDGFAPAQQVVEAMKKAREQTGGPDLSVGRRVDLLLRTVEHMSDDRLRHAWKKAPTDREKIVILKEANKRGLVQRKIEEHLNSTTDDDLDTDPDL